LFDLDKDGLLDLIVGEEDGTLNYYKNKGSSTEPVFELITDSLGKINVTDYTLSYTGYSTPYFFREDDQVTKLVVGSEQGLIYYFTNIDNNLEGKFDESDELYVLLDTTNISFDRGMRTAACLADIDTDGNLEMIAGNYSGGLEYFNGYPAVSPGYPENKTWNPSPLLISPNPAKHQITIHFPEEVRNAQIEICTVNGNCMEVFRTGPSPVKSWAQDISMLQPGIYLVKLKTSSTMFYGKFIVVR